MALSHHEQRALERIATDLHADDPWLASALAHDGRIGTRWQRLAAAVMFMVGMAMLASAIFVPRFIPGGILTVSILGYLVMFDSALRWFKGPLQRRQRVKCRGASVDQGR